MLHCLCYVLEKRLVSAAAIYKRRRETPREVLAVLTSFMVETREARRCGEAPGGEGEKKQRKRKETLVKKR